MYCGILNQRSISTEAMVEKVWLARHITHSLENDATETLLKASNDIHTTSFIIASKAAVSSACFWLWRAIFSANFLGCAIMAASDNLVVILPEQRVSSLSANQRALCKSCGFVSIIREMAAPVCKLMHHQE